MSTMDARFFRSREFFVGLAVALVLIAGVAVATTTIGGTTLTGSHRCSVAAPEGVAVQVAPQDTGLTQDGTRATRTLTYTLPTDAEATRIAACTSVGSLRAIASEDGLVHVTFFVAGTSAQAVEAAKVEALFAREGDELRIAAQVPAQPQVRQGFQTTGASVTVTIHLPPDALHALDLHTHVGNVDAHDLRLSEAKFGTHVGHVRVTGLQMEGDLRATSEVGNVRVALDSVQSGLVRATSDTGRVDVRLPVRADIGYDVAARADVGRVMLDVGETDTLERTRDGPGERVQARTAGYADQPTQVRVEASTGVGNVAVHAGVAA